MKKTLKPQIIIAALLAIFFTSTSFTTPTFAEKAPNCGTYKVGEEEKHYQFCCGKDADKKPIITSVDFGPACDAEGASSITVIMLYVINFLAVGVGIAVVGGIAWGGWIYASSNGDAGKAKEGRMIVINAVIGLVLFLVLWAAVNFLVPGGLFG